MYRSVAVRICIEIVGTVCAEALWYLQVQVIQNIWSLSLFKGVLGIGFSTGTVAGGKEIGG